nr:alpha-1,6-glucosidase domain-containing protein [uncultured Actinomyces sp.]
MSLHAGDPSSPQPPTGPGNQRAFWLRPGLLALPRPMLSHGTYPVLHAWSDGDQGGAEGGAGQGDGPVVQQIPLVPAGELTPDVVVGYPQLRGYCALTADISRHQAARMLRGRLVVELGQADSETVGGTGRLRRQDVVPQAGRAGSSASRPGSATSQTASPSTGQPGPAVGPDAGPSTGQPGPATGLTAERSAATSQAAPAAPASPSPAASPAAAPVPDPAPWRTASRVTGVQIWPLLDHLYPAAARRDGLAPLGPTWAGAPDPAASPSLALWAPTAQEVTLLSWETGDPTGSVPLVEGEPRRTRAESRPDGRWEVGCGAVGAGAQYLWEVRVYVPATGRVETNVVTDPYAPALTVDSRRAVAVDLRLDALAPRQWATTPSPRVTSDAARAIYELHVRDFSAADPTVPEGLRGTYAAFTVDSQGTRHLRDLAEAGMDTLHLMPTFDIATIPEERSRQKVPAVPASWGPVSVVPQQAVAAVADEDAYNWGYDPYHWLAPEGSYATEGHQDGGARVAEHRAMVGALHAMGLQVVLDQVFSHTAACGQEGRSVLDRVVPGYYHRLDECGRVQGSSCSNNVATERAMARRLMIDACVTWRVAYGVDGFRFDLMGHHSRATMEAVRDALARADAVAVAQAQAGDGGADAARTRGQGARGQGARTRPAPPGTDAVAATLGPASRPRQRAFLYGEGWNFGEVKDNALFIQATQGQLAGTGIGTFNDRVRDALRGGGVADLDPRAHQGLGTGEYLEPNRYEALDVVRQQEDLAWRTDIVRLALGGNLRDLVLPEEDGVWRRGDEIVYGQVPAAYGVEPVESVNYVESHDNETLYDVLAAKLPEGVSLADRARMSTLCLAAVTLGQSPVLWLAGTELLRSKSMDRNSYDSGDHFNAIDWSGRDNGWGRGLPPAACNRDLWMVQSGLLMREDLRPGPEHIALARKMALDLLRIRRSTPLLTLGSADLIKERVSFPARMGGQPGCPPGVIVMLVDDGAGSGDIDPRFDGVLVVFNPTPRMVEVGAEALVGRSFRLHPVQAAGADPLVRATAFDMGTGSVRVPGRTAAVLVES